MGAGFGVALKFVQWFIRGIQFCSAGLILAIYSYFLATLHNHDLYIATWIRAVEGISGAATLYSAIGLLLLCCLAGLPFTSFVAIGLDVAFAAAFVYVAIANRGGVGSCSGSVDTAFGSGNADTNVADDGNGGFTNLPSFHTACKLETACFAVSIVAIIFFILSAFAELALVRHHRKAKRFGPGPANDYTSGYGRRSRTGGSLFSRFGRRNRHSTVMSTNPNALPAHTHPDDVRPSYTTDATAVNPAAADGVPTHKLEKHDPHLTHPEPPVAHYPAGNYRYDDGVYNARAV